VLGDPDELVLVLVVVLDELVGDPVLDELVLCGMALVL
jgi:hypothetical protein